MEFSDELIINARRKMEEAEVTRHSDTVVEQEIGQSIYDDVVTIFGIPVVFSDCDVIENRATFRMPADFIARSEEEIASVYFFGAKPQYVFSNGYLSFMVAFNWTTNLVANEHIPDFTKAAETAIDRFGPKSKILNVEKLQRANGNLSIVQFIGQTFDSVNMNIMFFASIDGRLLIGSITFDQKNAKRLHPLAVEMAKSFQIKGVQEVPQ